MTKTLMQSPETSEESKAEGRKLITAENIVKRIYLNDFNIKVDIVIQIYNSKI